MSRIPRAIVNPSDPESVVQHLYRVQRVVDGELEFGCPQDPNDPQSTALADGAAHNGLLLNVKGAWVELEVETLNANTTCTHNLNVQAPTGLVNVRWLVFGWQHDNTGAGAGSTVSVLYVDGNVGENSIALRFYAAARTVSADHPLKVTLFFTPAVR